MVSLPAGGTTPRLDLGSLLAHPDNGDVEHIAGPTEHAWNAVAVDVTDPPIADGLLILTAPMSSPAWQQDALVRRVRDLDFSALALPGAATAGPGARRLASRLGLTLLDVRRPVELARACWQLQHSRDALTIDYVRKVAQAFEYPARDLGDLLRHLSAAIGHGVALIDGAGVVGQAGGELDAALHAALDFSTWISNARADRQVATSVRVNSATHTGMRLLVFGNDLSDNHLRALSTVAEIMMPAVAARIMIDELALLDDTAASSDLLRDFLELRGRHDQQVLTRMAERGWRTSGYHLGFQFLPRARTNPPELLRAVSQELTALASQSQVAVSGENVLGWLSFLERPAVEEVQQHASALQTLHRRLRHTRDVALGIGSLQEAETGLAKTLNEAADASKLAATKSSTGYLLRVDGLGLEQLMLAWTGTDTFIPAAESLLEPLLTDAPELLDTLAAYLDHESSVRETAEAMGLHRNTVALRIKRAEDLLGVDLHSPDNRLALHLACRAVLHPGA